MRRRCARFLAQDLAVLEGLVSDALVPATLPRARPERVRAIAAAILAAIQGSFLLAGVAPELIPRGSAAESVRRMADGLLDAPPARTAKRARSRRSP